MKLKTLQTWLSSYLALEDYESMDASMNGIQVTRRNPEVKKVAVAVDACLETFQRAEKAGADLLFVHHGLFWGKPLALTGSHYERISFLMEHDMALFAAHLPLDAHPESGNNAGIANALGIENREPFGVYHGTAIGFKGNFPEAVSTNEILRRLSLTDDPRVSILPFGPRKIQNVGIVSGGAANQVADAIDEGLDAYITGEPLHQVYHDCMESGISMISGGHYNTEVYGVKQIAEKLKQEFALETCFIDVPTGL
ncbi:MAG: Nif3-like dinuclear metal center hexameric protein [Spirochaetales bacterium]|nr:Nif3-like dinuclear metal center hexameric protein [Spirochaetales bacterium]